MTTLEVILSVIIYISLGLWLCNKCDWFKEYETPTTYSTITIVLAPILLTTTLIKFYIIKKWDI